MPIEPVNFDLYHPEPLLVVISGPSGVGKDAVVKALMTRGRPMHFVVTATSREKRESEVDGVDYIFVTKERFEEMIAQDELIEYALVYNQYKGIPKEQVRSAMHSGKDVIMRLDVQGAQKIRQLCPEAVLIFLLPTSDEEWRMRLIERGTETEESLALRQETVREELKKTGIFDYIVPNPQGRLHDAVDVVVSIIEAEHHRVVPRRITL